MRGRLLVAASVLFGALVAPVAAHASPPSNDNFTFARGLNGYIPVLNGETVDLSEATLEAGEPLPSCTGGSGGKSVWYRLDPTLTESQTSLQPQGGPIQIQVTPSVPGSFSPTIAAYSGSTLSDLSEVGCANGIRLGGSFSPAFTHLQIWRDPRQTLFVQIVTVTSDRESVSVGTAGTAGGDDRRAPIALKPTATLLGDGYSGDAAPATNQPGDPAPSCAASAPNVWLRLEPATAGELRVNAQSYRGGYIAVYHAVGDTLTEVACSVIPGFYDEAVATFAADALGDYRIEASVNPWNRAAPEYLNLTVGPAN